MALTLTSGSGITQYAPNRYRAVIAAWGTGDGSGGTNLVTLNPSFLKATDKVYVAYADAYHDDAATTAALIRMLASDWSALAHGMTGHNLPLVVVPASGWLTYGADNYVNPNVHRLYLPSLYLGSPVVVAPEVHFAFSANTNLKAYRAMVQLDIIRVQ